jgi:hypothetical protein
MRHPFIPQRLLIALIAASLVLPIVICVVFGVAGLLSAMGDTTGGAVLHRIALGFGVLWVIELICLVVVQAISALSASEQSEEPEPEEH